MKGFSWTTVILVFVLSSFGQIKTSSESIQANTPFIRVTLLGTGTPQPLMDRFGPSILVEAGSEILLFDAGRGCIQRLRQLDRSYDKLTALFLTHLHSDHIVGLPDLWLTGSLISERKEPLKVFGPLGTADLLEHLQKAFAYDIKIRVKDDGAAPEGSKFLVSEIQQGTIYENNGVRVIAITVDHFPVEPAFGYRIEYKGHAVVLSGDTRYSENLIHYAKGTDLIIHEVALAPDTLSKTDPKYHILAHHTTPEQAAKVFNEVKPKCAAYSHIVNLYAQNLRDLMKRTKAIYHGPLMLGEDLMSFSIADTVVVSAWKNK